MFGLRSDVHTQVLPKSGARVNRHLLDYSTVTSLNKSFRTDVISFGHCGHSQKASDPLGASPKGAAVMMATFPFPYVPVTTTGLPAAET